MCNGCNDPFVTYLKSIGYNPIRLPRADIRPLELLVKTGRDLDWLGHLTQLFVAPIPAPGVKTDEPASNVSGQSSGELSLGIGLSLLGNLIGAMGGSKLGVNASYKGAKSIVFHFSDVLRDSVPVLELDKYLGQADVDPAAVTASKMLDADSIYVVTSTIKSRKFGVESKQSSGVGFDVDVPIIEQVVGGGIKVSSGSKRSSLISYEGPVPLVFGFEAVQLFYNAGRYTALRPAAGVVAKALAKAPNDGADRLVADGAFAVVGS